MVLAVIQRLSSSGYRTLQMCYITRNYSYLSRIQSKHKYQLQTSERHCNPQQYLFRNSSHKTETKHRHKLLVATYISFGIGVVLITAIIAREVKRMRMRFRGIHEMNVSAWRRVKLYKYKEVALPGFVINQLEDVEKFEVKPDDVWVVSFPRSGTTWLQEIVFLIHSDFDMAQAQRVMIDDRFPYLEFMYPGAKEVASYPSPRFIKSHLPYSLLPSDIHEKKPKIIYIVRNPKDVVVSFYYYIRYLKPVTRYDGKFEDFCDLFIQDKVMYAPWWRHVLDFWNHRDDENILFIKYEDLQKDTAGVIKTIANFLNKTITEEQVEFIKDYCSFDKMKNNDMTNHSWFKTLGVCTDDGDFIRKGKIGDWTSHLNADLNTKLNRMITLRFRDTGLAFDYHPSETDQDLSDSSSNS